MIKLCELAERIKQEKSIAIFCHIRPDGDTLGSALALKLALINLGISADVICDDAVPSSFLFLNQAQTVKNVLVGDYTALLAIDCADITRLGNFAEKFQSTKNTYNIDHHVSNTRYARYNYVQDEASNCENVYELLQELGATINEDIANLLALGVMTDTGNFHHKNVTPKTLFIAGKLVENGADLNKIYYYMFSAQSKERAKLFGTVMQRIRYFEDGRFAVATIRLVDLEACGAKANETEGFIDFVMGIHGVEVGACIMEISERKFKISLRSKSANVNAVASSFGGGGHILASGCQIFGEYEEVIDKLRFAVSRELPE